jgi:hypoxanthine-guanine phosphoribosyltransferase
MATSSGLTPDDTQIAGAPVIEPFITEDELQSRVGELADEIARDYRRLGVTPEQPLHMIGVL